jgi:putative transposase
MIGINGHIWIAQKHLQLTFPLRCVITCCIETEVSLRTYRRWLCGDEITVDKRPDAIRPEPGNKLSEQEHQRVIETCNEPEYANLPPSQIVPILLDDGIYHASESSYYRVLNQANQFHRKGAVLLSVAV